MTDQAASPDAKTLIRWEIADYRFQHNLDRVEQAANRLGKKGSKFAFRMSWTRNQGLVTSLDVPDERSAIEFAVAMSRFLLETEQSATSWIEFLKEISGQEHHPFLTSRLDALHRAREGEVPIVINGEKLSSAEAYEQLATRVVFASDTDATRFLEGLRKNPVLGQLMWMMYYNYCLDVYSILSEIMAYRKVYAIYPPKVTRENHCIYCKGTEGSFTQYEHTVPEALGNESSILPRGYVCDSCNNRISAIEQQVVDNLPFSLLRVLLLFEGKKGKLPTARFADLDIRRLSPNQVEIRQKGPGESLLHAEQQADGTWKFSFQVKERVDVHLLSRGLMKMALGVICLEEGREAALDPKYDLARRYIMDGGTFPNRVLVQRDNIPLRGGRMEWVHPQSEGTGMMIQILGATFIISLSEKPEIEATGPLKDLFLTADLQDSRAQLA